MLEASKNSRAGYKLERKFEDGYVETLRWMRWTRFKCGQLLCNMDQLGLSKYYENCRITRVDDM
jgi:hypothetical protein